MVLSVWWFGVFSPISGKPPHAEKSNQYSWCMIEVLLVLSLSLCGKVFDLRKVWWKLRAGCFAWPQWHGRTCSVCFSQWIGYSKKIQVFTQSFHGNTCRFSLLHQSIALHFRARLPPWEFLPIYLSRLRPDWIPSQSLRETSMDALKRPGMG